MTPERWKQIDRLFAAALDWAPDQRSKLLRQACADDEELRLEVESLLNAHAEASSEIEAPGASVAARLLLSNDADQPAHTSLGSASTLTRKSLTQRESDGDAASLLEQGATVHRFLVLEQLGRGGMGVVFSAYDPQLDRKVALKLLRPGAFGKMTASEGRARLLREAQALARLSHPNVIAVFDVGTFEDQVFIAMEYIEGRTLTLWLKEAERSWRAVLDAFIHAGRGLAAAHASGLIHRDFKPDNVLVGNDGRICVLDFGLARAAPEKSGESTIARNETPPDAALSPGDSPLQGRLTQSGLLIGTPAYMAPEQLSASTADARTDQFSFCAALYEGLYGELPFEKTSTLKADRRIKDPPKSSQVPSWVRRVVLRGLRADPTERYRSMDDLLGELGRDHARLRRRVLAATSVILLIAAVPITYRYAKQHQSELCQGAEQKLAGIWDEPRKWAISTAFAKTGLPYAESALAETQRALDAYAKNWVAMEVDACKATRVRGEQSEELLDLRMDCLGQRLAELKSLTENLGNADARLVSSAQVAVRDLSLLEDCTAAAALKARLPPPDPRVRTQVEEIRRKLAAAKGLLDGGKYKDGLQVASPLVAEAKTLGYRPLEAEALETLGSLQERDGDPRTAEKTIREALLSAEAGRHDRVSASGAALMVYISLQLAKWDESLEWAQRASAAIERIGGNERLEIQLLKNRGGVFLALTRFDEARADLERGLAIAKRVLDPDDPEIASIIYNLGGTYAMQDEHEIAIEHIQIALRLDERTLGPWHPNVGLRLHATGASLERLGKYEEALTNLNRALGIRERALGKEHVNVAISLSIIGRVLYAQKKYPEALANFERTLPIYEKVYGPNHPRLALPLTGIGMAYVKMREPKKAFAPLRRADQLLEGQPGNYRINLAQTQFTLAMALRDAGLQFAEGRTLAEKARTAYAAAGKKTEVEEIDAWLKRK